MLAYLKHTSASKWAMPQLVARALANLSLPLPKQSLARRRAPAVPARDWSGVDLQAPPRQSAAPGTGLSGSLMIQ
ncbi:hypothetical protein GCM10022407_38840 [Hymenobacter antarcticus]|uniref:Uncharacterized protein n=1 Tax=Hymenobacter antarcticus TaxID=486270 RepID=A0ABP7QZX9_9BACT